MHFMIQKRVWWTYLAGFSLILSGCSQGLSQQALHSALENATAPAAQQLVDLIQNARTSDNSSDFAALFAEDVLLPAAVQLHCADYPETPLRLSQLQALEYQPIDDRRQRHLVALALEAKDQPDQRCTAHYQLHFQRGRAHHLSKGEAMIASEAQWVLTGADHFIVRSFQITPDTSDPALLKPWPKGLQQQLEQLGLANNPKSVSVTGQSLSLQVPFDADLIPVWEMLRQQQGFRLQRPRADGPPEPLGLDYRHVRQALMQAGPVGFDISVELNPEGTKLLADLSSRYLDQALGIYIGDTLISAPVVKAPITGGSLIISGEFSATEAKLLADQLNFKPLPFGLNIVPGPLQESTPALPPADSF